MDIGVVTRTFNWTVEETARAIAEKGFRWTELCFNSSDANYFRYNGRSEISELSDARAKEIVETYRKAGVEVAAIGCYTNLIEPNDDELDRILTYFERHLQIAAQNGIPAVATECGFRWDRRGVRSDEYEKDFKRIFDSILRLCETAEKLNVDIAIEACVLDVIPSAKRLRDFILQTGSKHVKAMLDPANLIANSSEEDMFKYLTPHISYFHGKDRKVNDAGGRAVGDGEIDWPLFLALYHKYTEGVPFILEYVTPDNCTVIRDRVLEFDQKSKNIKI